MSSERVYLIGYPSDMGGASAECWHTLQLWRRFGLDIACVPTWGDPPPCWRARVERIGAPTITATPDTVDKIPGIQGAVIVSFCNSHFLQNAWRFRDLQCRIVWVGCMNWLFDQEKQHYKLRGPFDAYVFQSQYQQAVLGPQLEKYGVRPEQMHLVRAAFMTEEWPFQPRTHKKGEPLVVGRISRPAPDKFHPQTWRIYERIPHPVRARIMAWGSDVERKLGPPPPWAECLPAKVESAQQFMGKLHVMMQVNGEAIENWPRSGLEAMASGVAIVAPRKGGWCEMIRHGVTGFLADTEDEMAYYAAKMAYEDGYRQFVIREARRRLEEELAPPETIWGRWKQVFQSVGVSE